MPEKQLILLYHFFYPDDVISARLFADLALAMADRQWTVTAMPSNRLCHQDGSLPLKEQWNGVNILRVPRPALRQSSTVGRLFNSGQLLLRWTIRALFFRRTGSETVIIGTDPVLAILVAIPWRLLRPRAKIVHWCHDLHPEASVAEGSIRETSPFLKLLRWMLSIAYRRCDAIADLGPCMRQLLQRDLHSQTRYEPRFETITPWALFEPESPVDPDLPVRHQLFGNCQLTCLYSGNLGRAHEYEPLLELARAVEPSAVSFCFSGRGSRMAQLKSALRASDRNIHFADFASEDQLASRLAAGDVHLVSLRPSWTGTVVPSKFFGALAIGRPVLFVGASECAIARWIDEFGIGWHLRSDNFSQIVEELSRLAQQPERLAELNQHCLDIYRKHFSKKTQLESFGRLLDDNGTAP